MSFFGQVLAKNMSQFGQQVRNLKCVFFNLWLHLEHIFAVRKLLEDKELSIPVKYIIRILYHKI